VHTFVKKGRDHQRNGVPQYLENNEGSLLIRYTAVVKASTQKCFGNWA
jgi:hypothetical protein